MDPVRAACVANASDVPRGGMLQLSFREDTALTLRFSLSRSVVIIDAVYVPFAYTSPEALRVLVKAF